MSALCAALPTGLRTGLRTELRTRKDGTTIMDDDRGADARLRQVLGGEPPAGIRALSPEARAELADLVADARRRQERTLEEAFHATLKHVPFPVRGIVKKVLMG
jgi:hypothetical protein